jgi:predicted carbohydrate-binding protein with CBM5 and CBM33 domain
LSLHSFFSSPFFITFFHFAKQLICLFHSFAFPTIKLDAIQPTNENPFAFKMSLRAAAILAFASVAYGHGVVTSPPPRRPGTAMIAACGQQAFNNMGNPQGNVQGIIQVGKTQTDYDAAACNAFLCKGFKYADNTANVQKYTAGQVVPFSITIGAPHTGVMNVSVVDTASNSVIGAPLISQDDYASTAHTIPEVNKAFSVTIPDVGAQCSTPGACVLQWFWDARSVDQTYEDCIDFTIGGGGAAPAPAPAPITSVAAAASRTSAVPTTFSTRVAPSATATLVPELECDDDEDVPAVPLPSPSNVPEYECDE